jgi:hypothetical protein
VSRSFVIETSDQRERLFSFIKARDLPIQVEVGEVRQQRSLPQNARLWSLHTLASRETGYTPDELHELMLCKFFGTKEVELGGVKRTVPLKRSSARDKAEFRDFLDAVENFYASELGVWLGKDE